MREDKQAKIAALSVIGARSDMRTLATFDHRDHRFNLRTAALRAAVEADFHETTVAVRTQVQLWIS